MSRSSYRCDGCNESILPQKARIHCLDCVGNYNVCANCYVVGNYTQRHEENHSTSLIELSGYSPRPPPVPPRRPNAQQFASPPSPNLPRSTLPPPPGPPPFVQQSTIPSPGGPPSIAQQRIISPSPVSTVHLDQQAAAQPTVKTGWQPLFYGSAPTSTMVAFLEAVFICLDTDKDGLLEPEQYSAFLDVQGYGPDEDVWKKNHKEVPGYTADDIADFELKTTYENWSIQHEMRARPNASTSTYIDDMIDSMPFNASFATLMKATAERKTFSNGMMPMLTLPGFINITTIEILSDPSPGWIRVNRIAQHYNIWREWGDIPRSMMPDVPPKELLLRIKMVTEQARAKAQAMLNAAATEAEIKAQGRENAIRLLDPPGTRYVYRYN